MAIWMKSTDPAGAIERLRRVREIILAQPERFDMGSFFDDQTKGLGAMPPNYDLLEPGCGTACCIAGWAIGLEAQRMGGVARDCIIRLGKGSYSATAASILGMDTVDAERLFFPHLWPLTQRDLYNTGNATDRAMAGAAVIDLWIEALRQQEGSDVPA